MTCTTCVPVTLSAVTVIVAVPSALAVRTPDWSMLSTALSDEL